jgi:hypothetical protein
VGNSWLGGAARDSRMAWLRSCTVAEGQVVHLLWRGMGGLGGSVATLGSVASFPSQWSPLARWL